MSQSYIAVLDLGTNTFHLLIAEVSSEHPELVFQETVAVKLGEGGITAGVITEAAFERGKKTLKHFSQIIKKFKADHIRAAGTAALRSAANGKQFIQEVKEETGIEIEIIDGDREAELIYKGVRQAVKIEASALIMDIGGGSVEFIICNAESLIWKKSYPAGAVRLMALFHKSDPISDSDIQQTELYLKQLLTDLKIACDKFNPKILIGSAGAFETFAELITEKLGLPDLHNNRKEFSFSKHQFNLIADYLFRSTHQQREQNPRIIPVRVDMIITATILTRFVLNEFEIDQTKVSYYALKEGLLFDVIEKI
ncbi:exopolyphosphatase [Rubrolithibacter danxiaensis]|uniref:Ppx/GppA phosphatase family protein n=1 Tax=Rubrolithibacter danxiaensis TaxID=3390805 RepID=UPI003BF8EF9A